MVASRTVRRIDTNISASLTWLDISRWALSVILLNVLWLVGCLLLVTSASSTAALLAAMNRWRREKEEPSARAFLVDVRETIRSGSILSLAWLAVGAFLAVDFRIIGAMGVQRHAMLVAWFAVVIALSLLSSFVTPVLAFRRNCRAVGVVRISVRLALVHPARAVAAASTFVLGAFAFALSPILLLILPVAFSFLMISTTPREVHD